MSSFDVSGRAFSPSAPTEVTTSLTMTKQSVRISEIFTTCFLNPPTRNHICKDTQKFYSLFVGEFNKFLSIFIHYFRGNMALKFKDSD